MESCEPSLPIQSLRAHTVLVFTNPSSFIIWLSLLFGDFNSTFKCFRKPSVQCIYFVNHNSTLWFQQYFVVNSDNLLHSVVLQTLKNSFIHKTLEVEIIVHTFQINLVISTIPWSSVTQFTVLAKYAHSFYDNLFHCTASPLLSSEKKFCKGYFSQGSIRDAVQ